MIIFDLDGTLADCEHRRHFVDPTKNLRFNGDKDGIYPNKWKPDWKAFYEACDKDGPILAVVNIWNLFEVEIALDRAPIQIWSGRCESVRNKTINWIEENLYTLDKEWIDSILKMRPIGDYTPDDVLKERWLDESISEGKKIDMVFDDRKKVIEMWIRRGIFVFDVSQRKGNF